MFFSKIRGLWREEKHIFISAEYGNIRFHINEIGNVRITDRTGSVHTADDLPVRNAEIQFLLKSGRMRTCYVRKLTKRRYKYLQELLNIE